jgi:hypothetical protein
MVSVESLGCGDAIAWIMVVWYCILSPPNICYSKLLVVAIAMADVTGMHLLQVPDVSQRICESCDDASVEVRFSGHIARRACRFGDSRASNL